MQKFGKKKAITLDDLAAMTQRGFSEVHKEFTEVHKEFAEVHERFEKLEFLLIGRHDKRLDKLENDMRIIKTLLEKKLSATFPK
ncbi:MAG: hypothetical protein Q7S52_03750 [bacterium]|nr:hypothetical protein [bacterium]